MLGGAALFAVFFWLDHKSGVAVATWAVRADRRTHPIGFWVIQIMWATLSAMLGACGLLVLFGVLPGS
jgi:hypothetical protein